MFLRRLPAADCPVPSLSASRPRIVFALISVALLTVAGNTASSADRPRPPNVVFILADDKYVPFGED
jgi:hypothetical protein